MDRERIENPLVHRKRFWALDCLAKDTILTPLAGWVWAMRTDPREGLRKTQQILLHRIKLAGLRVLAFGKVELVKIG